MKVLDGRAGWWIVLALALCSGAARAADEPVNVAHWTWGTDAFASSVYGPDYAARNVLDGRWARRETDKWNSALNKHPHWLAIDLGCPRRIDRIVIRHEKGSNVTSDFRLQGSTTRDGPWTDLGDPVAGNRAEVSTHSFDLTEARFVRLWITRAEQRGNAYGRVFEVEVYSPEKGLAKPELPPIHDVRLLLRKAEGGKLTDDELARAAEFLDHDDPFVRAHAEWAIARKVGFDNNTERVVWPKADPPEWYAKWTSLILDDLVELDWARQAIALGVHDDRAKLAASVEELVERAGKLAELAKSRPESLARVEKQTADLRAIRDRAREAAADVDSLRRLYMDARRAMRPVVFANPAVDFNSVILYTRSALHYKPNVCGVHVAWAYKPGGDVCVVSGLESGGAVRELVGGRLGPGHVHGMDLGFDAERVAFGWANQGDWPPPKPTTWPRRDNACFAFELRNSTEPPHIYEMGTAGGRVRQLTDDPFWTDIEPVYCPDGSVAFTSDRSAHSPSCDSYNNDLTDHNIYSLSADRTTIRRLTNQKDVDMHPHLLANGLIAYLRWEYQERHFWDVHSVWTVRPDGTMSDALFKQHFGAPVSVRDARSVPGTSLLVAIAAGHHCLPVGPVVLLDPTKGLNNEAGVRLVTKGSRPQERSQTWRRKRTWDRNIVPGGGVEDAAGYYQTPFALSEHCFLVSYAYGSKSARRYEHYEGGIDSNGSAVYLIDAFGSKELVYRHPLYCAVAPVPFGPRARPPRAPDMTDYSKSYATCFVPDVHEGMRGVEPGTVKYIRIAEALPWPIVPGEGVKRWDLSNRWCPVRVIGTVPVDPDGSAHFKVPTVTNASVYFQALDENHMEVRRMRSSISFQPGEVRGCNGCHETLAGSSPSPRGTANRRAPDTPVPPAWGARKAIGYEWLVQPVLDRHCVKCHGGKEPKGGLDYSRGKSYNTIVKGTKKRGKLVALSNRESDGSVTQVKQFGSHRSKLILTLLKGHNKVKLPEEDWLALVTWVDANAPNRDTMQSKRKKDGRKNVWELFPWKDPWAAPSEEPARREASDQRRTLTRPARRAGAVVRKTDGAAVP
ncbi:MAG: HzsA-related protein [Planctomycetota bacterium]